MRNHEIFGGSVRCSTSQVTVNTCGSRWLIFGINSWGCTGHWIELPLWNPCRNPRVVDLPAAFFRKPWIFVDAFLEFSCQCHNLGWVNLTTRAWADDHRCLCGLRRAEWRGLYSKASTFCCDLRHQRQQFLFLHLVLWRNLLLRSCCTWHMKAVSWWIEEAKQQHMK